MDKISVSKSKPHKSRWKQENIKVRLILKKIWNAVKRALGHF